MSDLASSLAAAVVDVPSGADRDELHAWLHALDPERVDWVAAAEVEAQLTALQWRRLTRTSRFWAERPADLADAVTALATGLWHVAAPVGLRASGGPDGLEVELGTPAAATPTLERLLPTLLPGSVVQPVGARPRADGAHPHQAALWGPPPPLADGSEESVLGRLSRLTGCRWSVHALFVPAPLTHLEERCSRLAGLTATLATGRERQITVDDLTTVALTDPEVVRLADAVERERSAAERTLASGAWAAAIWVAAPTAADLHAVLGTVTATRRCLPTASAGDLAAGGGARGWRALRCSGGTLSIAPALLSSHDVGEVLRPPLGDRLGLPCRRWIELDRHPEPAPGAGPLLTLGTTEDGATVALPTGALTSHALLTGAPGSGKTSTIAALLVQLHRLAVPWLAVEPIKDEYRRIPVAGLVRWAPGSTAPGPDWVLNPLEVPDGTSVQSHIERLIVLLRATFGMVAPLPHLVELGLQRVYERRGWDLADDRPPFGSTGWPTLSELVEVCQALPAELGYAPEIRANLAAALAARLGTLTRGPKGRVLDRDVPFPVAEVLARPVVVNLDAIGDDEVRAFLMGLLLIRLREARHGDSDGQLLHLTVIDEAHRLLGPSRAPTGEGEGAGASGATADQIADLLAEIRSSGEGILIADQSPSRLVPAVLSNTSTKIALRADAAADQQALGAALALTDDERPALGGLVRHESLVTWEGADRPIVTHLHSLRLRPAAATPPSRPAPQPGIVRPDARLRALLRTTVRSSGPSSTATRSALLACVQQRLRSGSGAPSRADVDRTVTDLLTREVDEVGRARGWDAGVRARAVTAVLAGADAPDHPARLLLDGRQPHLACAAACPHGGCLLGEPMRVQVDRLRAEGPATLVRLAADPQERRRRLQRRALEVVPSCGPPELQELALDCGTVALFDEWADPETVAALVAETRAVGP